MKISCRETGHYQACRQAGEDASPDHGDSRGRSTAEPIFPGQPCRRRSAAAAAASITGSVVSSPASKAPNEITGYVAAGVVLHFDLFRVGVVGRRQR
jgi:hypothetical protein